MTVRAFLPVLCLLAAGPARAGGRAVPGASFNGVFFPYAIEEAALDREPVEKPECSCWRSFDAIVGGATAFAGYVPFALNDSRIGVSDTQRVLEWSAVTAGTAVLGYCIGKKLDRRQTSGVLPRGCH
jgi:hypothetical protein